MSLSQVRWGVSLLDKLEKLLQDTLRKVGGDFHPSDPAAARQRFLASRRRRRLYAFVETGAAVGMAALAVVFITRANIGSNETEFSTTTEQPRVVATIDTTANPVAVAVGEGAVWMTDSEGGGIKKIDPTTNEEVDTVALRGEPDEVLVGLGYVWATDTAGMVYRIEPATGVISDFGSLLGTNVDGDVRLDVALTTQQVWALDPDTGVVFTVGADALPVPGGIRQPTAGLKPNDIATQGDEVWVYDAAAGRLERVDQSEKVLDAPTGDGNSDLAVGFDAAWIATGAEGKVYRVDLESGDLLEAEIGGRYGDLSIDITEEAVWALAIDDLAGTSEVFELDPVTAEIVSEPVLLPSVASDMSVGEGSIWVPDEGGQVRRISSEVVSPPAPDESAEAVTELPDDQLLYVFVRDDDLFAQYVNGEVRLTDTPQLESAPTVWGDGASVAYVRRETSDGRPDIYEMQLPVGAPQLLAEGGLEPSYGPNKELAWIVPTYGILPSNQAVAQEPHISFKIAERAAQSFPLFAPGVWIPGMQVTEVAWEQTATRLYIGTSYEGHAVDTVDVEIDGNSRVQAGFAEVVVPEDRDSGGVYQSPTGPFAPVVIHGCCFVNDGDLLRDFDLGRVDLTAEGARYESIADLDMLGIEPGADLETATVGGWTPGPSDYEPSVGLSYLVLDDENLWFVDGKTIVPLHEGITGLAAPFPFF